jgi:hypothetical protein
MIALDVTSVELLELMANSQFPAPTKIGISYDIHFDPDDGVAL